MEHERYMVLAENIGRILFYSNKYVDYNDARSLFDKLRLARRGTQGLWLGKVGSKQLQEVFDRNEVYCKMESTTEI